MSSNVCLDSKTIIEAFISRWNQEVTHREAREHLGLETQRQWADQSIERTTPVLFALYSLIVMMGKKMVGSGDFTARNSTWYKKKYLAFSDILVSVCQKIWRTKYLKKLQNSGELDLLFNPNALDELIKGLSEVA